MDYTFIFDFLFGFITVMIISNFIRNRLLLETKDVEKILVKKFFVEKINGILYLYEYETDTFICQGKTLDELASLSKNNAEVALVKYDETLLFFIVGEVKYSLPEA